MRASDVRVSDAPSVKPEVVFTEDLLEQVASGNLRIPRFQRPFVWKPSDMLNLFDSMFKGYPIGSLLIWESSEPVQSLEAVGPLQIPDAGQKPVSYILDGQQRLSTLYAVLRLPRHFPLSIDQEHWKWWIWFDLERQVFTHVTDGFPEPHLLPMRALLRTVEFLTEARRLQEEFPSSIATDFIAAAEQIAQRIKSYKLAVVRIEQGSLEAAVDIFSRLNSRGRVMAPDQMISALTYREGSNGMDLASRIDRILDQLTPFGFDQVNRQMVFRSILAADEQDIHSKEWNALASNIKSALANTVDEAGISLVRAAEFLNIRVGVPNDRFLPYSYQMVLLSEFFRLCPHPSAYQVEVLARWFWATSLSGWFAGANTTNIDDAITEMRRFAATGDDSFKIMRLDLPARPYPERFDARSARIRALLIFLLGLDPLDPESGSTLRSDDFLREGGRAFTQVFPNLRSRLVSNPANRVLIRRRPGVPVKDILKQPHIICRPDMLASHAIPAAAADALRRDDGEAFVRIRAEYIAGLEREFMRARGITLPERVMYEDNETDSDVEDAPELALF